MNDREFTDKVTTNSPGRLLLQSFLNLLDERNMPFCVIRGLAVQMPMLNRWRSAWI